jgi:hypothetical protein
MYNRQVRHVPIATKRLEKNSAQGYHCQIY